VTAGPARHLAGDRSSRSHCLDVTRPTIRFSGLMRARSGGAPRRVGHPAHRAGARSAEPAVDHTVGVPYPIPPVPPSRPVAAAVVLAGGSGTRVGAGRNKVYLPLGGRPVLAWSLETFGGMPGIGPVVLVVRAEDREDAATLVAGTDVEVVTGGGTRQESELAALRHLAPRIADGSVDVVLLHDGARPLAGRTLAAEVLRVAREAGGAVPGLHRDDLAAIADDRDDTLRGPAPDALVAVQTPQAFRAAPLLAAYEEAARHGFAGTDTASCMERFAPGVAIRWVPGEERNFKITYAHDLVAAEHALQHGAGHPEV
jgi:2-C-methyl-D-erythritol 4-phosphate cytidylyltransferase